MTSANSAVVEVKRAEVSNKVDSEYLARAFNLIDLGYCGEIKVHDAIAVCLQELGIDFIYEPAIACCGRGLLPELVEPSSPGRRNSLVVCNGAVCRVVFPDFYLPIEKTVLEVKCKLALTTRDKQQFAGFTSIPRETASAIYCVHFNDKVGRLLGVYDISSLTHFQMTIPRIYLWAKKGRGK
jgi:hypothetical protein